MSRPRPAAGTGSEAAHLRVSLHSDISSQPARLPTAHHVRLPRCSKCTSFVFTLARVPAVVSEERKFAAVSAVSDHFQGEFRRSVHFSALTVKLSLVVIDIS